MNLSLIELKSFVTVAEYASFQDAADTLAISQSALTRRVQKLEEGLGVKLLERTTRSVALTTVGREFLPKARRLLDDMEASLMSMREIRGRVLGQINVAALPTAANSFLPDVLARFNQDLPRIRIRIIDEVANSVLRSVMEGEADFGISIASAGEADIEFTRLFEEHFVLACPEGHPLATKERVEWADLQEFPFIRAGRMNGNRTFVDYILAEKGVTPNWSYEVQHLTTSLGLVRVGLGITVLPSLAIRRANQPDVVTRPIANPSLSRTIGLIRRRGGTLSPAAQTLFDLLIALYGPGTESDREALS